MCLASQVFIKSESMPFTSLAQKEAFCNIIVNVQLTTGLIEKESAKTVFEDCMKNPDKYKESNLSDIEIESD